MPGKGSYGPGGKWIYDRAKRIQAKGDLQERYGDKAEQVSFALATQQAHKLGKTPKRGNGPKGSYGTRAAKAVAKAKMDKPRSEYRKTAGVMTSGKTPGDALLDRIKAAAISATSRDNRTPFVGGTQFPTEGSKAQANQQLKASKTIGVVGPNPSFSQLNRTGVNPSYRQAVQVPTPAQVNNVAKISEDPLIKYLSTPAGKAEAQKLAKVMLDTNLTAAHPSTREAPLHREDPFPSPDVVQDMEDRDNAMLAKFFTNFPNESPKL